MKFPIYGAVFRLTILLGIVVLVGCSVLSEGSAPASTPAPAPAPAPIHHVWQQLKKENTEISGYGLYTYVLASGDHESSANKIRYKKLAKAVTSTTDRSTGFSSNIDKSRLNLFLVPTQESEFDFRFSQRLITLLSLEVEKSFADRGPYLFTVGWPVSLESSKESELTLFVDLSRVHEDAFPMVIGEYKSRIVSNHNSEIEEFRSFRVTLLDLALDLGDAISIVGVAKKAFDPLLSPQRS